MNTPRIVVIGALLFLVPFAVRGQSAAEWNAYKQANGIDPSWSYNAWVAAGMPRNGGGSGAAAPAGPDPAEQLGHDLGTALGNQLANALFGNKSDNGPSQAQFQQAQMSIAAQQLNNTGLWYLRQKDYPSAINEFQQALERDPNDPSIAANLSLAQQQYGVTQTGAAQAARARAAANRPPGASSIASAIPDPNEDESGQSQANEAAAGNPVPAESDAAPESGAAPISPEFGRLYNEAPAAATEPPAAPGPGEAATTVATHAADSSPLAQELNTSPGGVGNPDFDGNAGGNAALGQANAAGPSTGTPAFGEANSPGLSPDTGSATVVDLRGKTGIVEPGATSVEPPATPDIQAPGAPAVAGTPRAVDPLTLPGSSGIYLPPSPASRQRPMAPPASNPLLDAMYASASAYEPGRDATPNYKFIRAFGFKADGVDAALYGEWMVDLTGMTLAQIDEQRPVRLILAFRGTDDLKDWVTNARNTYGHQAPAFEAARDLAREIRKQYQGVPLLLTGHSLGGGEAALASFSTGLPAITFNAEGVRPGDYGYNSGIGDSQITNYFILGEPLTSSQAISYGYGKVTGDELASMALQVGRQIPLFPMTIPSIANRGNHSMIAVEPAVLNYVAALHP